MKRHIFTIVAITTFFTFLLSSCNSKVQANEEMQKPISDTQTATKGPENPSVLKATNIKNMQEAFKGETTASAKYAAYSKKADAEGYKEIALLFKVASKSESIHASNHKVVLEDSGVKVPAIMPEFTVKTTAENLKDAIEGEGYEISTMYPEFITNANAAGNQFSLVSLNYAYKTEKKHKILYEKALTALQRNTVSFLPKVYFVCPTCGNTYDTTAPKRCGISMTSSEKFIKIS